MDLSSACRREQGMRQSFAKQENFTMHAKWEKLFLHHVHFSGVSICTCMYTGVHIYIARINITPLFHSALAVSGLSTSCSNDDIHNQRKSI